VVARRAEGSLLERRGHSLRLLLPRLRRERRRERRAAADAQRDAGTTESIDRARQLRSCLVARRATDRLRKDHRDPPGPRRGLGHECRRTRAAEAHAGAWGWPYAAVAWSPDGRKLAPTRNRDGNAEVYTINSDGSGLRRLTDNPEYDGDAVWSPDGRQLVFVSNRDGSHGVYLMNADGSGQRRLAQPGG
jgi:dipeptidyl aminopeptidase/acylaminoacyl peptidase